MSFFAELDQMRRRTYAMGRALNNVEHAVQGLIAATNGPLSPPAEPREARPAVEELEPRSIDETIDSFDAPPSGGNQDEDVEGKLRRALAASQRHHRYTPPPVPAQPKSRSAPPLEQRRTRPGGGPVDGADIIAPWPNPDDAYSGGSR